MGGGPHADGQPGKGGERREQIEEGIDIYHTCKYMNYTEESKLEPTDGQYM